MSEPLRIGIVGTENTHVDQIIDRLNVTQRTQGARVVALAGGRSERNVQLADVGQIDTIVDESSEMLALVDALIVTNRDGGLHRQHAVPFLAAGLPVWVDKPLACSTDDAQAILDAAVRSGAPVTSYSALRWIPDTEDLLLAARQVGDLQTACFTGPADPDSVWGGIFFYGIHPTDVALRLLGGPAGTVSVQRVADTVVARFVVQGVEVTLQLVKPLEAQQVPFHGSVTGRTGLAARELVLSANYVVPGLQAFLQMVQTGTPPISYPDLIRPIAVLEQVAAAL